MFTVPDVETPPTMNSSDISNVFGNNKENNSAETQHHSTSGLSGKRRRGRNPVDKEYRRLKRYLNLLFLFNFWMNKPIYKYISDYSYIASFYCTCFSFSFFIAFNLLKKEKIIRLLLVLQ